MKRAAWRGTPPRVLTLNAGVNGAISSAAFGELGALFKSTGGTALRGALLAANLPADTTEPIALAGFSAGFAVMEAMLVDAADRARIVAVGAFDAYYTSAAKSVKPGYAAFAKLALAGERQMTMTSSHVAGKDYPSGFDAASAFVAPLKLAPIPRRNIGPAVCDHAEGRGSFRWYVYADRDSPKTSHAQNATVIAPVIMPELVGGGAAKSSGGGEVLLLAAAAVVLLS